MSTSIFDPTAWIGKAEALKLTKHPRALRNALYHIGRHLDDPAKYSLPPGCSLIVRQRGLTKDGRRQRIKLERASLAVAEAEWDAGNKPPPCPSDLPGYVAPEKCSRRVLPNMQLDQVQRPNKGRTKKGRGK